MVQHRGFKYKYQAYIDDVLFIIENPVKNISELLGKILAFGDLAHFVVNKSKKKNNM